MAAWEAISALQGCGHDLVPFQPHSLELGRAPIMENQMEKKMENEMETTIGIIGFILGLYGG